MEKEEKEKLVIKTIDKIKPYLHPTLELHFQ